MWSLGATLYTMVVGRPPYMARNEMELIEMHKTTPLQIPNSLDPHLRCVGAVPWDPLLCSLASSCGYSVILPGACWSGCLTKTRKHAPRWKS